VKRHAMEDTEFSVTQETHWSELTDVQRHCLQRCNPIFLNEFDDDEFIEGSLWWLKFKDLSHMHYVNDGHMVGLMHEMTWTGA
jgi:hypothetical protein